MNPIEAKIAIVPAATRGAACVLAEAGVTVYCTGRSGEAQPTKRYFDIG